jgi:REP element-mobilizing transposase RayT
MLNHFHLVLETPNANLVAGMRWFLSTYTARFNRRHKQFGHLFSGRYKSLIVDGSGSGYLRTVCDYVHMTATNGMTKRHPLESQYRTSFLEFTAWQRGRCVFTYIHPNVSTQGPPTSRAVQVNPAKFPLGSFTRNLPANRVRPQFARRTFLLGN